MEGAILKQEEKDMGGEIAVLTLERLPELETAANGRRYRHMLNYKWLNPATRGVRGSENIFCSYTEVRDALKQGLFASFRLFP